MNNLSTETLDSFGMEPEKNFTLKNSVKAFNILSDSLYMNKVLAVERELSTNAFDAHIAAGNESVPFEIHLPNESFPFFYVRDFGTGMTHDQIMNLYTTYFDSTKTDSLTDSGYLGLGSKSPFSLVDTFAVTSYQNGIARNYIAFKNDAGVPSISFVQELEEPDEKNGLKIQFAVRRERFNEFATNIRFAISYFDPMPNVINHPKIKRETFSVEGSTWKMAETSTAISASALVVQARIPYPIDFLQIQNIASKEEQYLIDAMLRVKSPLRIFAENRTLDYTPSRENLQYNKKTVNTLIHHFKRIYDEMVDMVSHEFSHCSDADEMVREFFAKRLAAGGKDLFAVPEWEIGKHKKLEHNKLIAVLQSLYPSPNNVEGAVLANGLKVSYLKNANAFSVCNNRELTFAQLRDICLKRVGANPSADLINNIVTAIERLESRVVSKSFKNIRPFSIVPTDDELETLATQFLKTAKSKEEAKKLAFKSAISRIRDNADQTRSLGNKTNLHLLPYISTKVVNGEKVQVVDFDRSIVRPYRQFFGSFADYLGMKIVIDDAPKGSRAQHRAFFDKARFRGFYDYVLITPSNGTGGKFTDVELLVVEEMLKFFTEGQKYVEIIHASSIIVPPEFEKPAEVKSKEALSDYSAFNIIGPMNSKYHGRREVSLVDLAKALNDANSKVPNYVPVSASDLIPSRDDQNVLYFRRSYSSVILGASTESGRTNKDQVTIDYAIDDDPSEGLFSVHEILNVLGIVSNRDLINDTKVITIKTMNEFKKAKKNSKWTEILDFAKAEICKLNKAEYFDLIFALALHNAQQTINCVKTFLMIGSNFTRDFKNAGVRNVDPDHFLNTLHTYLSLFAYTIRFNEINGPKKVKLDVSEMLKFTNHLLEKSEVEEFKIAFGSISKFLQKVGVDDKDRLEYFTDDMIKSRHNLLFKNADKVSKLIEFIFMTNPEKFSEALIEIFKMGEKIQNRFPMIKLFSPAFIDSGRFIMPKAAILAQKSCSMIEDVVEYTNKTK
jgi:hypothetical protein